MLILEVEYNIYWLKELYTYNHNLVDRITNAASIENSYFPLIIIRIVSQFLRLHNVYSEGIGSCFFRNGEHFPKTFTKI